MGMSLLKAQVQGHQGQQYLGVRSCGTARALAERQGGAWLFQHRALQPSARFPLAPVLAARRETFAQLPINHLIKGICQSAATDQLGGQTSGP